MIFRSRSLSTHSISMFGCLLININGHHKGTRGPDSASRSRSGPRDFGIWTASVVTDFDESGPDLIFRFIYQWGFQKDVFNSFPTEYRFKIAKLEVIFYGKTLHHRFKTLKIFQGLRPWTPLTHLVSLRDGAFGAILKSD